jgi:hypothetical protein
VIRDQIVRSDFPSARDGYDRPSVDAHLEAVAALTAALEAQINALEVGRDALRRQNEESAALAQKSSVPAPDATESALEPAHPDTGTEGVTPAAGPAEPAQPDDEVSARLVATRLALEGAEREQIREKLEATYDLEDADSLVDDVLERLA